MLIVGDILPLPPVKGLPIYCQPKMERNKIWMTMTDKNQKPIGDLWNNLEVVLLKPNYRQGQDREWTELLNRVRIGEPSVEDIEVLKSRDHKFLSKKDYQSATHLFYTNRESTQHNTQMLNTVDKDLCRNKANIDVPKDLAMNLW